MRDAGCEEHSPYHPRDVRIHSRHRLLVGKARHCAGGVRSDTWKLSKLSGIIWHLTPGTRHLLRKRVEIRSPGIVSQPIPSLSRGPRLGARECRQIRETLHKPRIVLRHPAHLRLLQHELGDEHAVRVAGAAPWEIARGAGPPGQQAAGELRFHLSSQFRFHPLSLSRTFVLTPYPSRALLSSPPVPLSTSWRGGTKG